LLANYWVTDRPASGDRVSRMACPTTGCVAYVPGVEVQVSAPEHGWAAVIRLRQIGKLIRRLSRGPTVRRWVSD
jgi:hypothetical protein